LIKKSIGYVPEEQIACTRKANELRNLENSLLPLGLAAKNFEGCGAKFIMNHSHPESRAMVYGEA
jgi:hypothetical protein